MDWLSYITLFQMREQFLAVSQVEDYRAVRDVLQEQLDKVKERYETCVRWSHFFPIYLILQQSRRSIKHFAKQLKTLKFHFSIV